MDLDNATIEFINAHKDDDIRSLAFKADKYPSVNMSYALDQIAGRQKAKLKIPGWASIDGIIYPQHISMEQCSSEQTAVYKASVAKRLLDGINHTTVMIDITGGLGVDFSYIKQSFDNGTYIERQSYLCDIASHNFQLLGLHNTKVLNTDGVNYIHDITSADLIYIDPARRDSNGARTFAIKDCTPDITGIVDELLVKSYYVMIKLSPMLDWHKAVADINSSSSYNDIVKEVHIVSVDNECKELLLILSRNIKKPLHVYCVNNNDIFDYENTINLESSDNTVTCMVRRGAFLFEPNSSIMKAGCFDKLTDKFNIPSISKNSHLYLSDKDISDFPGRRFIIDDISTMNKKELKLKLSGITKANIAIRNFPLSVSELRKKLKLKDGGDIFIFGTTIADKEHVLIICHK